MISPLKKIFLGSVFYFLFSAPAYSYEWISLSESLNPKQIPLPETLTSRHALTPSMTYWDDYIYLAWTEPESHGIQQIYIKRSKDGRFWEQFGKSQNKERSNSSSTPFIATNGKTIFLTWTEKNDDNISQVYAKKWNGSEWVPLGGALNVSPEREAKSPFLAFLNEVPYLAWNEAGEKEWSKLFVKHWDGKSWISDGPGFGLQDQHITQAPFLLFEKGTGHLVWAESDENRIFQIHYAKLEDGKWIQTPNRLNQYPGMQAFNPSLTFFRGDLYLIFQEKTEEGSFKLQLRHLTPEGWKSENERLAVHGMKSFNPVLISDPKTLLIAWEEWDGLGIPKITVQAITQDGESKMVSPLENRPDRFRLNPLLFRDHRSTYLAWKELNDNDLYQIQIRRYLP